MPGGWAHDIGMVARLARDLLPFLRTPVMIDDARAVLRRRLQVREQRFLHSARQLIYGHARSPHLRLLRAAGCEYGDLEVLVAREGLEGALAHLADAGVYVTFEEFKGRKEAVRGGQRFQFAEDEFNHPHMPPHYEVRSGGTRGPATAVGVNLAFVADLALNTSLALSAHGLAQHAHLIWLVVGVTPVLLYAKLARPPVAWVYPVRPLPLVAQVGGRYLAALSRLSASRLPAPAFLDLRAPGELADRLAALRRRGTPVCVTTYASSAVRVAIAAAERGIDLSGVCFITLGEPFTEAKGRLIAASGAQALVRYAFTEGGIIGYACAAPHGPDDLHFFRDCYALVQRQRPVSASDITVGSFLFSSLLPTAPKVLLNVESGDYGVIDERPCGCELGSLGLTTHLSRIRSFEKLSGEGMTFVQTDLLRVLEEVLPARFGGTAADYQVLEEEENGILRLSLIISPRVGAVDEQVARDAFLEALEQNGGFERLAAGVWRRAETVVVRRQWPAATKAGKILPFQLAR
ncbi:MAG: hypothetical protein HY355_07120 [Armatimonadetes bacterium]|nr:hypothetical protein [Armatimonadota bacterium]